GGRGTSNAEGEETPIENGSNATWAMSEDSKGKREEENNEDMMENGEENDEEEEESSEEDSNDSYDECMFEDDVATEHEYMKQDVAEAAKMWHKLQDQLGIPSVQIEPSVSAFDGECSVVMTFNVSDLPGAVLLPNMEDTESEPKLAWHLWNLENVDTVAVIVDGIHKREFRAFQRRPEVFARINNEKPSRFPIGECLINIVKPVITNTFTLMENLPPSLTGSFFAMLYEHLMGRLETLTEFCLVCGEYLHAGAILPSICDGALCQYQYQELGLLEGLSNPRCSAPVLSLLLTAFNAAANSGRWRDILTPSPSPTDIDNLIAEAKKLHEKNNIKWDFNQGGNFDVHSMLVRAMPCARQILRTPSHYREFKQTNPNIAEFVEWLVTSNQSFLELVPSKVRVDFLRTSKQFIFIADTPAKQAEFDVLKNENGGKTRYLFHGSKMENWHSIIRSGLKNMSGTKYMLAGAAYGAGIYLSNLLSMSYNYCTQFGERNTAEDCVQKKCCLSGMALLAVVEVVDTPKAYRHNSGSIVVVTEEKWCSIRMLVAYNGLEAATVDLDQMTLSARRQVDGLRSFSEYFSFFLYIYIDLNIRRWMIFFECYRNFSVRPNGRYCN
ncbi:hypothetical protein PMAYCL1PPCAC_29788, partial [Pristionchus mayeri]